MACIRADFVSPQIKLAVQLLEFVFADSSVTYVLFIANKDDRNLLCFLDILSPLVDLLKGVIIVQREYKQYTIEVTHVTLRK